MGQRSAATQQTRTSSGEDAQTAVGPTQSKASLWTDAFSPITHFETHPSPSTVTAHHASGASVAAMIGAAASGTGRVSREVGTHSQCEQTSQAGSIVALTPRQWNSLSEATNLGEGFAGDEVDDAVEFEAVVSLAPAEDRNFDHNRIFVEVRDAHALLVSAPLSDRVTCGFKLNDPPTRVRSGNPEKLSTFNVQLSTG